MRSITYGVTKDKTLYTFDVVTQGGTHKATLHTKLGDPSAGGVHNSGEVVLETVRKQKIRLIDSKERELGEGEGFRLQEGKKLCRGGDDDVGLVIEKHSANDESDRFLHYQLCNHLWILAPPAATSAHCTRPSQYLVTFLMKEETCKANSLVGTRMTARVA